MIPFWTVPEDTVQEAISPAEERFERIRRTVGLFLGPAAGLLLWLLPLPLDFKAHRLAAILVWVVIYWVTEAIPIPITALLGPIVCFLAAVGSAKDVLAPFANPVIFLFIGSFFVAQAMLVHGLDRRMALAILSQPWIGASPARVMLAFGVITAFLSMWMSNTATTAMMFPIAMGILGAVKRGAGEGKSVSRYATGLMLMVAYSASVGGIGTLVGTPPNLIGVGMIAQQVGVRITFFEWMKFAVPLVVIMYGVLFGLLYLLHHPGRLELGALGDFLKAERRQLGRMNPGERNAALAFLVAVVLWISPGVVGILAKAIQVNPVPPAIAACLGASYGFMLPISTPPNAIVYGSGLVPITRMLRAGILFDILGFFLIWLGLRLLLPLFGMAG